MSNTNAVFRRSYQSTKGCKFVLMHCTPAQQKEDKSGSESKSRKEKMIVDSVFQSECLLNQE
ncbi:uncharacterized protein PHALS_07510 [Plasmopara halstedii]|uniref:Uncharacterized protein n=1 Tax=Plasmopara halstedii TaxID=4781 RepID=A0A0P1B6Q8_PLAHL|nr:uncharacterized protein PHALS_07510 [Plasmopara halstedii]CEG49764.1 hypothetical protein PHALS_07510 [Plasmopara halstedii]|eukprot:XP_024586133.1 hypothetical protein PHALS_07510 [Plasmopara halstedii]